MLHDLGYALRGLRRAPGFAFTVILTLALGVGANTAIFSVVHHLLIDPLPYPGGDRMVFLWRRSPGIGGLVLPPTIAMTDAWRRAPALEALEVYRGSTSVFTGGAEPEEIAKLAVRPGMFGFLGVQPRLGRVFVETDLRAGAEPVALISEALWRRAYAADPRVLGSPIVLDDVTHTIVGVLTPAFQFRESPDDVWVPLNERTLKPTTSVSVLGRLTPGATVDVMRTQLDAALSASTGKPAQAYIMTPGDRLGPAFRTSLLVLTGAVGFLLLIVSANLANLLLARNAGREKEVAIRGALGAARWRIARQFLAETLVLALAGGLAGLLVAAWLLEIVFSMRPEELGLFHRVTMNVPVLAFGVLVSLATGLLFGVLPAFHAARRDVVDSLKIGARAGSAPARQWLKRGLTAAQVGIALVLLVGAGLLARSYIRLQGTDLGFRHEGLVSMRFELPESRYRTSALQIDATARLLENLRAMPGVERATVGPALPPQTSVLVGRLRIEGRTLPADDTPSVFAGGSVDPEYFLTLGIPLKDGRVFTDADRNGSAPVAIVNEGFARRFWPGASAVGQRIAISGAADEWQTIVGVVGDVRAPGTTSVIGRLQIYTPLLQAPSGFGTVIVRTNHPLAEIAPALKAALWSVDPKLPAREIQTAQQLAARSYARTQFNLVLLSALAALGLALAAVGLYGVLSFLTAQRVHEIGVRLALGAPRRDILALVLRQSLTMTGIGLAVGLPVALALTRLLERLLYGVRPNDPLTFAAVALFLLAIALLATWLPARRAAALNPIAALRAE